MDLTLRCNSLKCRTQLSDRAVVTTCSHIFCIPCSDSLGLSDSAIAHRVCPACETQLGNPDDAVITQLNPTEDYKTSVLSGLNPGLIMECASRGMAFFQYQTTQEILYQDYMAKSLTDKYATLSSQMDNVINDANAEIMSLRDKLSGLHMEKKNLETKNQELANALREKSRAQQRLQGLYQKLKSQQNAHHIEHAAADDAESVIHTINDAHHTNEAYSGASQRLSGAHARSRDLPQIFSHARVGSAGSGGNAGSSRNGMQSPHTGQGTRAIPQRTIPQPAAIYAGRPHAYVRSDNFTAPGTGMRQITPNRQPLGPLDPNVGISHGVTGYGVDGTAKVDRGPARQFARSGQARGVHHVLHR